jgi:ABC transporter substrate binding protein
MGGLLSYSADLPELFRQAAVFVDKLLKGANPAELPVQQPTRFELQVNLKTAKALGLAIPDSILARADEVIELKGARSSRGSGVQPRGRWWRALSKPERSIAWAFLVLHPSAIGMNCLKDCRTSDTSRDKT